MRLAIILLISSLGFAQGMGGKSGIGGKAGFGGGVSAGGGTFTVVNQIADRDAFTDKLNCTTTTCTITVPSTTGGDIGILQFEGETGTPPTISSVTNCAATWTRPTGASNNDVNGIWTDGTVCTNLTGGVTSIVVTFSSAPDSSFTNVSYYQVHYTGGSVTPVAATLSNTAGSLTTCLGPTLSLSSQNSFVGQTIGATGGDATAAASPYNTHYSKVTIPTGGANTFADFALSYIINVTSTVQTSWTVPSSSSCLTQAIALKGN